MARKIAEQSEAAEAPSQEGAQQAGVTFVKNQVNELIKFEDGTSYVFPASKVTISDEKLVAKLRKVAGRHGIFEKP